jgi:hypothetical protein
MPSEIEAVLRAKEGVQLDIRNVFIMFGILSALSSKLCLTFSAEKMSNSGTLMNPTPL